MRAFPILLLLPLTACIAQTGPGRPAAPPAPPVPVEASWKQEPTMTTPDASAAAKLPATDLFEGWDSEPPGAFAAGVRNLAGAEAGWHWSQEALAALRAGLQGPDLEIAVRAAVLLARSSGEAATRTLIERLEARVLGPERNADAADVVAAAALAARPGVAARLEALAVGEDPHPDLEVRVECAASAFRLGRAAVAPFLLRVLRAGTPEEAADPIDWTPTETMAWAKSRAAEALEERLGTGIEFQPDASFEDQRLWIQAFAAALGRRGKSGS